MAKKILSIDLSREHVKVVELECYNSHFKPLKWAAADFAEDIVEKSLHKALVHKLRVNNIKSREAIVSISGDEVIYKLISLPDIPQGEIHSAIEYKLAGILSLPIEDIVFDYYKIEELCTQQKQLFFVSVISKKYVSKAVEELKKAGLRVKDVIPSSCALYNSSGQVADDTHCLVYIGKKSSIIVLVKKGQVVFAREAKVGGETITQSMVGIVLSESGKIELDHDKAEELKDEFGIPADKSEYELSARLPAEEIMAMMRPALEKIGAEILRTIEYYHQETCDASDFKKIYLTGGASKTKHLAEFFNDRIGISAENVLFDAAILGVKFAAVAPLFGLSIGCAAPKANILSLLPIEYKYPVKNLFKKTINLKSESIAYLTVLAVVYAVAAGNNYHLNSAYGKLQQKMKQINLVAGLPDVKEGINVSDFNRPDEKDVFFSILNELDLKTPSDVFFTSIFYDHPSRQMVLNGIFFKKNNKENSLTEFISSISASAFIGSADLSNLRESGKYGGKGAFDFEIKCAVKEASAQ